MEFDTGFPSASRLITDLVRCCEASATYAAALVKAGRFGKALRYVERRSQEDAHLAVLAAALVEAGQHQRVTAVVDRILMPGMSFEWTANRIPDQPVGHRATTRPRVRHNTALVTIR